MRIHDRARDTAAWCSTCRVAEALGSIPVEFLCTILPESQRANALADQPQPLLGKPAPRRRACRVETSLQEVLVPRSRGQQDPRVGTQQVPGAGEQQAGSREVWQSAPRPCSATPLSSLHSGSCRDPLPFFLLASGGRLSPGELMLQATVAGRILGSLSPPLPASPRKASMSRASKHLSAVRIILVYNSQGSKSRW